MSDVSPRTNRGTMFEQAGICVCNSSFGVSGFRAYQGLTALRPQTSLQKPEAPTMERSNNQMPSMPLDSKGETSAYEQHHVASPKSNDFAVEQPSPPRALFRF